MPERLMVVRNCLCDRVPEMKMGRGTRCKIQSPKKQKQKISISHSHINPGYLKFGRAPDPSHTSWCIRILTLTGTRIGIEMGTQSNTKDPVSRNLDHV
jgi:hypothetical protein